MSKEKKRVCESNHVEYSRYMASSPGGAPRQFPDDWGRWTDDARAAWQHGWNDGTESQRQDALAKRRGEGNAISDVPSCVIDDDGKVHQFATQAEAWRWLDEQADKAARAPDWLRVKAK
jgi:hypothetical protein